MKRYTYIMVMVAIALMIAIPAGAQDDDKAAEPVFLLPTASDKVLGIEKWGLRPTGVAG
jgi:hypothetical protein